MRKKINSIYKIFACILLCMCNACFAQSPTASLKSLNSLKQIFNSRGEFIKNIGQYGNTMASYGHMGKILFGYEGLDMPILFTPKGLIHLQRKIEKISHREEERLEKQDATEEEIEQKKIITDRVVTMEWMGANSNVEIISEEKTSDYHTYGTLQAKAFSYKKITYKNLYPGIDIVYSFTNNAKAGFEYSLVAKPGANLSVVKIKYAGDVKKITDRKSVV